jgi:hypothetical protein
MATATVTNTVVAANGAPITDLVVKARLWPAQPAFSPAGVEIAPWVSTTTNGQGQWTLVLERTDTMIPSGMTYQVLEASKSAKLSRSFYIHVPSGGGDLMDLLVQPPDAPSQAAISDVILRSPNGIRHRLTVANDGTVASSLVA